MELRTAIYIRVSTLSQAEEGLSLDTQIAQCEAYMKMKGYPGPACLFMDAGISAATLTKRPAMTLLIEAVKCRTLQRVVTTKLDRAFRNVRDASEVLDIFRDSGASLAFLDLSIDTSEASGEMVFNLMAAFAQFERKQIGSRIHAVNHRLTAGGRWVGTDAPFGFQVVDKLLVADPDEAEIVRRIFSEYAAEDTTGFNRIARQLNRDDVPSPTGKMWTATVIARILRNPVYKGEVIYGSGGKKKHERWLSEEGRARAQGTHEPLVLPTAWDAAREKMLRRRTPGRDCSPKKLYSGLLHCAYCQSTLYAAMGYEKETFYTCGRVFKGTKAHCPESKRIKGRLLDYLVTEALCRNVARMKAQGFARKTAKKKPETAERSRAWIRGKLERLREVYLEGDMERGEYERRRAALQADLNREEEKDSAPLPEALKNALSDLPDYLESEKYPIANKRGVVSALLERVIVGKDELTLHYQPLMYRGWVLEETIRRPLPHETPYKRKRGKPAPKA